MSWALLEILLSSGICPLQNKQQGILKTKMEGMLLSGDGSVLYKWQDILKNKNTHSNGQIFNFQNARSLFFFPLFYLWYLSGITENI
jgi:hypothetical protein